MGILQTIIYTISSGLLYPVMTLLVLLSIWIVILAGGILSEWIMRLRLKGNFDISGYLSYINKNKKLPDEVEHHIPLNIRIYTRKLSSLVKERGGFLNERIESLIQDKEMKLSKELDRIRFIVRAGPSLGLMGTLIPMGTGLAAMSQGDMAQMSSSLIIAFTTTVVGLAIGITAFLFSSIKNRWIQQDIRDIELITEAMTGSDA
ncbi:MAG: MotA/TolQ/ExbB proton channel family protein [Spirochaetota bacterium]|nr:MotA/TolQ/ExbB proton channel family protein [Spirochaetota bacterium]